MDLNKDDDKMISFFLDKILVFMIEYLLNNKEITEDVTGKELRQKIKKLIDENFIQEMRVSISLTDVTYKLFKEQFDKKNNNMAIILASTYLEQLINEFYQSYLLCEKNLSKYDCQQCLQNLKIKDKFGWFYKLLFMEEFNNKLYKYICSLFKERNSIIHYIPKIQLLDDEDNDTFDVLKLKTNIDLITKELNKKNDEVYENSIIAKNIYEKYYRD